MKAYVPPLEGRRSVIRLDFNENTTGFPDLLGEDPPELFTAYPEYAEAVSAVANWVGVNPEQVLLTNGSDEGLFVSAFTFLEPGHDRALVSAPTFSLIPHSLRLCQAEVLEVVVKPDLGFDLQGLEEALRSGVKLTMLASPDNPTGAVLPRDLLERWLSEFPQTVFVIDEAYYEYHGETALELSAPNLLVSRTFSKAWGLAGLRLGFLVGHRQMIEYLRRVRSPYSVNSLAVKHLLQVLPHAERVKAQATEVMERKLKIVEAVRAAGYSVTEGKANFFVVWAGPDARWLEAWMREHGILVRDRSNLPRMAGSVRVSVGSPEEMEKFLEVLASFRERTALIFDLDDTLVDTSVSYDRCIMELAGASHEEVNALRAEGGFNDDWEAATELLRRKGVERELAEVEAEGQQAYFKIAPVVEKPFFAPGLLERLAVRHRLFVFTGRPRCEYDPVWGERLDGYFEQVLCKGEHGLPAKPAPDGVLHLMEKHDIRRGYYVGNSVDDMACGVRSGLVPVGVTSNQSAEVLGGAGAEHLLSSVNELPGLLMMEDVE